MKLFRIDLRSLDPEDRVSVSVRFSGAALTSEILGSSGLEYLDVYWDSPESFPDSPLFPVGCSYREIPAGFSDASPQI